MASFMAISNGSDKLKRSFEFRMCKKVAELTQVVHMLFTRNHEKEIEMEALKEAYEFEICEVITDAKCRLAQMRQEQENMLKQQTVDADRIRKLLEGEFLSKERDWQRKLEESDNYLQEERTACQNLRDMLINAQLDIENLRQNIAGQMSSQTGEIAKRDREIERLKVQIQQLEQSSMNQDQESGEAIKELEQSRENLEKELRLARAALEESYKTRDQLLARNKQLEAELKALKRDFNRKMADRVNGQKSQRAGSALSSSQNEELERLRREIQRYRLELSNRDVNFNRMFTDKQPIHLERTVGGAGVPKTQTSHSAGPVHSSLNGIGSAGSQTGILKKDTRGPVICFQEQDPPPLLPSERQRAMSTPSTHVDARDSRFPSIASSPDSKVNIQDGRPRPGDPRTRSSNTPSNNRLSRPRPLPKEMLFSK